MFVTIVKFQDKGKSSFLLLLVESMKAVHAFPTLKEGLDAFTNEYQAAHDRSYTASMSACIHWMTFNPSLVKVESVEEVRSWFKTDPKIATASHLSGSFTGLLLDDVLGRTLWENGTRPGLIKDFEKAPAKAFAKREFVVGVGPHPPMLAIQAHDMTAEECELLRAIILNNNTLSDDYRFCNPAGAFLQGYEPPHPNAKEGLYSQGWVLVEFWCGQNREVAERCVEHINKRFEEHFSPKETQ